ncbi:hypothetical protein TNCV_4209851 [Trichonephila clavipes]|nr:hypothetical protein TNCV_4209851 [Trichonephila clavipes]
MQIQEKEIRGGASVSKTVYPILELRCTTGTTDPMRPDLKTIRKMSNRLKMWIGEKNFHECTRENQQAEFHPWAEAPAGRGVPAKRSNQPAEFQPTPRVPPLGRGARGEGKNTEEKGADEKFSDGVNWNEWTAASARGRRFPPSLQHTKDQIITITISVKT